MTLIRRPLFKWWSSFHDCTDFRLLAWTDFWMLNDTAHTRPTLSKMFTNLKFDVIVIDMGVMIPIIFLALPTYKYFKYTFVENQVKKAYHEEKQKKTQIHEI